MGEINNAAGMRSTTKDTPTMKIWKRSLTNLKPSLNLDHRYLFIVNEYKPILGTGK